MSDDISLETKVTQVRARLATLTPGTTEHTETRDRLAHMAEALTTVRAEHGGEHAGT